MNYFKAYYFRAYYFAANYIGGGVVPPTSSFKEWLNRARRRGRR